ncbi:hypothetical protein A4H97_17985 [Niastella yeongjuensis]|uniref:Phage tail collar domain-containing protein n=1 Tax=Niastella yeongjuensis TaxID=354355 RepID=A0A1V9DY67_9BACT|nr:hypothetical protein [Niastella yeongjuensis]OQP38615.1 hypothetical protein A4H97_17985 [Niastella yeongjuensis]SEO39441.1 hypothetical protein SAMN05660816_02806 [Niastella yeongjuensis]
MSTDNGLIGEIKYSILEPGIFTRLYPGWELLAGQEIGVDSELGKLGFNKLPDARGVFLRGMNEGRDLQTGDPDGNRSIGSLQVDDFKAHNHQVRLKFHADLNFDSSDFPPAAKSDGLTQVVVGDVTTERGGLETRPRNIAVYIYIKMN